ncbi:MAG: helix-turn-helix domain-containing protein [Erysipelotrichaceae bacterium]|jgi:transcriptional antiterminator|nr:helix-turn-helix domain-containing protein [Erysipelotrichaceae bacterium]
MLQIDYRQKRLLHALFTHPAISTADLSGLLSLSERTLQNDIKDINHAFVKEKLPLCIKNQRSRGYMVQCASGQEALLQRLQSQIERYLSYLLFPWLPDYSRVLSLLRFLLVQNDYQKLARLSLHYSSSSSTLTKNLNSVRRILSCYKLSLGSLPYRGLKILGEPLRLRSCFVDCCDLFQSQADGLLLMPECLQELDCTAKEVEETCRAVAKIFFEMGYQTSDLSFRRVCLYLLLLKKQGIGTKEKESELSLTFEYHTAKALLEHFGLFSEVECELLAVYLLAHLDEDTCQFYPGFAYQQKSKEVTGQLLQYLDSELNLDLSENPVFAQRLSAFLLKRQIRKDYGICEFNIRHDIGAILKLIPASSALAIQILTWLNKGEKECDQELVVGLSYLLYNTSKVMKNSYETLNFLTLNNYGHSANDSMLDRLQIQRLSVNLIPVSAYQLPYLDFSNYQALILTENHMVKPDLPIPVFPFNYFETYRGNMDLWSRVWVKYRKNDIIYQQSMAAAIVVKEADSWEDVFALLQQHGVNLPLGQLSSIRDQFLLYMPANKIVALFQKEEPVSRALRIVFKTPVSDFGASFQEIVFLIYDFSGVLLAVKQGDSVVKRLQVNGNSLEMGYQNDIKAE